MTTDDAKSVITEPKSEKKSSSDSIKEYKPQEIEQYWQSKWEEEKTYQVNIDTASKPFYNLMMFPYPSAEGLHVGSFFTYGGIDAYGRFKRMLGYDVFEPIGLDGFGIHSENYAIKVGRNPHEHARISEENFYRQLHSLGNGFDWSRKLETYDPKYYKWTQWLFTELFKAGLAYKASASVNFCPSCKTVLSDEQVIDGKCERCGTLVEKRELKQWFFAITNYADRLLANTANLDWTEKVKIAQKNWIGKKTGTLVRFKIHDSRFNNNEIEVFTTRPDTLFGATFLVVAPEHAVLQEILKRVQDDKKEEINTYIKDSANKKQEERLDEGKEKTGVFSGIYALNPVNNEQIPVWIADYVLMDYGTGAIMAVPAHDQRDYEFAKKYNLPIKQVIDGGSLNDQAYVGEGVIINSGEWNGLKTPESIEKVVRWLEDKGFGKKSVNYHLRDWLISRQRYWGPPIPMIYCEHCAAEGKSWFDTEEAMEYQERLMIKDSGFKNSSNSEDTNINDLKSNILNLKSDKAGWYPVSVTQLPVLLPDVPDVKPLGTPLRQGSEGQAVKSPLANHPEFYETRCPVCGEKAMRETDVSDTFLDSAWYFFRYTSTDIDSSAFDRERVKKWLPVSSYIGGAEHAVLHLLYSRFITMVLKDLGYIEFEEPYTRFRANGLIIKDGAKMSKSKGNVINPDDYVKKYGADTLRTYLGFIGPFIQGGDFQDTGIEGIWRFLNRVWKLVIEFRIQSSEFRIENDKNRLAMLNKTVKGVSGDMEELRFNTAIAKIMTYYNFLVEQKGLGSDSIGISREEIEVLLKLLAPFAPHMTEELWFRINANYSEFSRSELAAISHDSWSSIHKQPWPTYDESKIVSDTVTIAIQINGKLRETLEMQSAESKEQRVVEQKARELPNVKKYLEGKSVKKSIYVPGKILNFVI